MGKYSHTGIRRRQAYDIYDFTCPYCKMCFSFKGAGQQQRIRLHKKVCKAVEQQDWGKVCPPPPPDPDLPEVSMEGFKKWREYEDERLATTYGVGGCRYPQRRNKRGG